MALCAIEVLVCEQCGNKKNILFVYCIYFVGKVVQLGIYRHSFFSFTCTASFALMKKQEIN